jgi:hypothetical protein
MIRKKSPLLTFLLVAGVLLLIVLPYLLGRMSALDTLIVFVSVLIGTLLAHQVVNKFYEKKA